MATKKSGKGAAAPAAKAAKPAPKRAARTGTKGAQVTDLLKRPKGVTIEELAKATGWQAHSVRGFLSGNLKKKQGLTVTSEKVEGRGRVYRLGGQG
jgi:predicted ArsR family transcriptional regulator